MVPPLGASRSPTDGFLVFFKNNLSLDIKLVYARIVEAYTGFFVEVAAGGAYIRLQAALPWSRRGPCRAL